MSFLDPDLVDEFTAGRLDHEREQMLADQVARTVPWHWALPPPTAAALAKLVQHLGGEPGLREWLNRHSGRPRLVAQVYDLIALLDRISDRPSVVAQLRRWRERTETPAALASRLPPDTDEATLASLAGQIESLMGDDPGEAHRVALATIAMLADIAPGVVAADPDLRDVGEQVRRIDRALHDVRV